MAEFRPRGRKIGDEGDAVIQWQMFDHRRLCRIIETRFGFECHRTGQHTAIDLRQGDVHGDVARDQPGIALGPDLFGGRRKDGLQYRTARRIERRFGALTPRCRDRKTRRVQDDVRRTFGKCCRHNPDRDCFLQALQIDRQRVQAPRGQGRDQRINRFQIPGLHQRPVECDGHHRRIHLPLSPDRRHIRRLDIRPVKPGGQERGGLAPAAVPVQQAGGKGKQVVCIGRSTMDQILPDAMHIIGL